jgi:hypothetical protein
MSDVTTSPSSGEIPAAAETAADTAAVSPAPDANTPSSGTETPADASTDASSTSAPAETPETLLDAVKSAVQPKEPPAEPAAPETTDAKTTDPAKPADPAEPEPDPTETELAAFKPQTRKYIGKLVRQRQELRDQLTQIQPELDQHRQLRAYMEQHKLAPEDANLLLGIGAQLRAGNFKGFLDGVMPYVDVARQSLGMDVAPDLRGRVDDGSMTEDAARELTRTRLDALRARAEADGRGQELQTRDQQAQQQAHVAQVRTAVDNWEQSIKTRDPDYTSKEHLIQLASQGLLARHGPPKTAEDAVQLAQRAYDDVTASFQRARPAPQATRPQPAAVSTPSLGANREPRTLLEAVRQAASGGRAA